MSRKDCMYYSFCWSRTDATECNLLFALEIINSQMRAKQSHCRALLGAQKRYWSADQLPHMWQCVTLNTQVTKLQIHTCLNDVKECWPFIEKLWNLWLLENLLSPEGECTLHLFLDEGLIPFLIFYLKWNETSLSLYSKDTCITRYDEKLSAMVHNTIGNRNINNMIRE